MKSGWKTIALGDVAELINGRAYKKSELLEEGPYRVLRVGNFFTNQHWYFSDLELPEKNYCEDGDLLYAWSASFGPRIWTGEKCIFHYHIWKVKHDETQVLRDYLFYFFDWDKERIRDEQGAGATMIHVSKRSMEQRSIPLPPLEEQRRIVAVLDEVFAALSLAQANAEANLHNARELFESILKDEFTNLPGAWVRSKLKPICTKIGSGATPKGGEASYKQEGVSLIRSLNVHDRDFRFERLAFLDSGQAEKLNGVTVEEGDVLLNITGASIARCCIAPEEVLPARVNQHVSIVRPRSDVLLPHFLCFQLTAEPMKKALLKTGSDAGATRQAITKAQIEVLEVSFPRNTEEQRSIILRLQEAEIAAKASEDCFRKKLTDIEELRQSILRAAFLGELV